MTPPDTHSFFLSKAEPIKSCLLTLRDILLSQHPNITETTKYGMPCYCLGKKALFYLWTDKKTNHPYILLVDGKLIDHPKLESGSRARMKILNINPFEDINVVLVKEVIRLALNLHLKNGDT